MSAFNCLLSLALLVMMSPAHAAQSTAPPITDGAPRLDSPIQRVNELKRLSADLIERAQSSAANATQFRIDVVYYRETLRALMQHNPTGARAIPQPTLLALVRMTALLQAAAACETGRFIVCPPELIGQLRAQQRAVDASPVAS